MIFGYARGSTAKQIATIPAQSELIENYAKMKEMELAEVIVDEAATSKIPLAERPGGSRLDALVRNGKVKAIILARLDRAFRKTKEFLTISEQWDEAGIELHVLDFGGSTINTKTATGRMIFTVFAAIGEWERANTAERIRVVMGHMRKEGRLLTRPDRVPFGYQLGKEKGTIDKNPAEQETIEMVMALHEEGANLRHISKVMRKMEVKGRDGNPLHAKQIRSIIKRATSQT